MFGATLAGLSQLLKNVAPWLHDGDTSMSSPTTDSSVRIIPTAAQPQICTHQIYTMDVNGSWEW